MRLSENPILCSKSRNVAHGVPGKPPPKRVVEEAQLECRETFEGKAPALAGLVWACIF